MKIQKNELQEALKKVKPGLAGKEIIEQSTSFAFMGDRVVTYNDEISISHPVKNLNATGAVRAEELYKFLDKIKKDEIDIEWKENQVKITAGKSRAGLILQQEIKLPIEEIGEIDEWKVLPESFLTAVRFCRLSCSNDMSRPELTCVYIHDNIVDSSDGYRISRYTLKEKMPVDDFLLPATTAQELLAYDIKEIAQGEGWVHFRTEETIFSCRVFQEDEFPDIEKFLILEGEEVPLPKKLTEALERAHIFTNKEFLSEALVQVKLKEGEMIISAKEDVGWFEEKLRMVYKGNSAVFKIHPDFLIDISGEVRKCVMQADKIGFRGDNWIHVIALTVEE